MTVEWGTVGEWVSGTGTLLAVLATVYYSRKADRARAEEYREEVALRQASEAELRRLRQKEERREFFAQAQRVGLRAIEKFDDGTPRRWRFSNSSELSITLVNVAWWTTEWHDQWNEELGEEVPTFGTPMWVGSETVWTVLAPGESKTVTTPNGARVPDLEATAIITDAEGRRFKIKSVGRPEYLDG